MITSNWINNACIIINWIIVNCCYKLIPNGIITVKTIIIGDIYAAIPLECLYLYSQLHTVSVNPATIAYRINPFSAVILLMKMVFNKVDIVLLTQVLNTFDIVIINLIIAVCFGYKQTNE